MDRNVPIYDILQPGVTVFSSDREKLGSVVAVESSYFMVEKGFFFRKDYFIPTTSVASYDDDGIYLNVSKDEALNQGWDQQPSAETMTSYDATYAGGNYTDTTAGSTVGAYDADRTVATDYVETDTSVTDGDHIRVPVHEEELVASKRQRELGEVRIEKDVVAEEQVLDVPVSEERVRVQRRVVDRDAAPGETAFDETAIEVPVRGEEVEVGKRARVSEEVEIDKEVVQRTERVADTVRREEVHVEDATVADSMRDGVADERGRRS